MLHVLFDYEYPTYDIFLVALNRSTHLSIYKYDLVLLFCLFVQVDGYRYIYYVSSQVCPNLPCSRMMLYIYVYKMLLTSVLKLWTTSMKPGRWSIVYIICSHFFLCCLFQNYHYNYQCAKRACDCTTEYKSYVVCKSFKRVGIGVFQQGPTHLCEPKLGSKCFNRLVVG